MRTARTRRVSSSSAVEPRNARRAGFSLLEVLIAMLILSVGAASVLALFAAAASTHKRSVDRTHAALLAERIFSEVEARYAPDVTVKELTESVRGELPEQFGNYGWDLWLWKPATEGMRGLKRRDGDGAKNEWHEDELYVRVSVRWKRKARVRTETFHAIILPTNLREASGSRGSAPRR